MTMEEVRQLLEKLKVPAQLLRLQRPDEASKAAFVSLARSCLVRLREGLADQRWSEELLSEILLTLSSFACMEGEEWTTPELGVLSTSIIDDLAMELHPGTAAKCREQLVVDHLYAMLVVVQKSLKHGSRTADDDGSFSTRDSTYDLLFAHQMAWLVKQVRYPLLGQNCQIVMPCVLTALDHFSPPVKAQAMQTFLHIAENTNPSELRLYKDVILDAVCHNLIASDELWPLVVKMAVSLVVRIEGNNPRAPWYRKVMQQMLRDLELHQNDRKRRTVWLEQIGPQLQAMGLVLAVYLERLLNLLFYWLRDPEEDVTNDILVLACLDLIIRTTWPRIPHHASRIWEVIAQLYQQKKDATTLLAIAQTGRLLAQCGGMDFVANLRSESDPLYRTFEEVLV